MAKTRRKRPSKRERQWDEMEEIWERKAQEVIPTSVPKDVIPQQVAPLPPWVEQAKSEAQAIVTSREKAASRVPFSVQSPATDLPHETGGPLVWWTGAQLDQYIPVAEYGDPARCGDLRAFALVAPLVLLAESVLTKKVQSLQWTIEGGRNLAQKWQKRINNFENGDGWDYFIARWIRAYCESDKPATAELIRAAPSWAVDDNGQLTDRGRRAVDDGKDAVWEIVDARVMDPVKIFTTTSKEFPIAYHNSSTGNKEYLRPYRFMSLTDMPSVDDRYPSMGTCAVSRAVWAAQENRMVIRYAMEKMSENPGSGIGVINASTTALETALKSAETQRESRGVVYYKGVVFLPILDPTGGTKLEFLSFADLPAGFSRSEIYNILKEVVATAFGLDILELGSIPGRLGTATQAKVAAEKGRTKTLGAIMQGVERAFKYKLLPETVSFQIKKHDQAEELQRAQIDEIYFQNAIKYAQFQDPSVVNQYLVDKGAVPNEPPYVVVDLSGTAVVGDVQAESEELDPEEEGGQAPVADAPAVREEGPEGSPTELSAKSIEPRIKIDREGKIKWISRGMVMRRTRPLPRLDYRVSDRHLVEAQAALDKLFPEYSELLGA